MSRLAQLLSLSLVVTLGSSCKSPTDEPAGPIAASDAARLFAEQVCAQAFACECSNSSGYADEAACVTAQTEDFQATIDQLLLEGATWNESCAGELVESWTKWECLGPNQASRAGPIDVFYGCPVIKGPSSEGVECTRHVLGDSCSAGMLCVTGICVAGLTLPVPIGSPCEYEWENLPCVAGSSCVYDDNAGQSVCQALPELGDACPDYWCGPNSRDLICSESMICESSPGEGESCGNNLICAPGLYCDGKDFSCEPRVELGDGCGADSVCPVDARCISNICEASPPLVCSLLEF